MAYLIMIMVEDSLHSCLKPETADLQGKGLYTRAAIDSGISCTPQSRQRIGSIWAEPVHAHRAKKGSTTAHLFKVARIWVDKAFDNAYHVWETVVTPGTILQAKRTVSRGWYTTSCMWRHVTEVLASRLTVEVSYWSNRKTSLTGNA